MNGKYCLPIRSKQVAFFGITGRLTLPAYQNLKEKAMTRIDELLGIATIATAGMVLALVFAPVPSGKPRPDDELAATPVISAADVSSPAPIVRSIEVVARPSVEIARIERDPQSPRPPQSKGAPRPKA